jgi:hypothetical protein
MTDGIDTLEMAKHELAADMVPSPDDIMDDLSPLGQLYFAEQTVYECLKRYTAALSEEATEVTDTSEGAGKALVAISEAAGMLDVAMVEMGMLPAEAVR